MTEHDHLLGELGFHDEEPPRARHRRRRHRGAPLIAALITLVFLGLVALGIAGAAHRLSNLLGGPADYPGAGTGSVMITVYPGETATQIAQTLYARGVVASVAAFTDAAYANPRSRLLGPGYYRLRRHMKASLALSLMLAGTTLGRVTIPEGFTVADALIRISQVSHIPLAQLQAAAADPSALGAPAYVGTHLEGVLFPDTYPVPPGFSATQALAQMVAMFNHVAVQIGLVPGAAALHESPYAVLILASIIQHEGVHPADFPKIARVFYNRLAAHMPLGSDATLFYVLGPNNGPLTAAELKLRSPYNTRINLGLPPTPIDNPGQAALLAALHPAAGPWLYFTTMDAAGDIAYETTYAQHQRDAAIAASRGLH